MTDGPLGDLRVVDAATVLAGPGCAKYLADFGADAEVIAKIERPEAGWTAGFVELTFDIGAPYPFKCSTQVLVWPNEYPHEYEWPERGDR